MNPVNAVIRDLISDVRFSERSLNAGTWANPWLRSEEETYLRNCRDKAIAIFRQRHSCRMDRYGWPL